MHLRVNGKQRRVVAEADAMLLEVLTDQGVGTLIKAK